MLVIGARGLAKQIVSSMMQDSKGLGKDIVLFDDINRNSTGFSGLEVLQSEESAKAYFESNPEFCIGHAKPKKRRSSHERFSKLGGRLATYVSEFSRTPEMDLHGVTILPHSYVELDAAIGKGTLINVGVFVAHDAAIGEFCEISPAAQVLGNVRIGNDVFVGSGAVLLPGVSIGDGAIIGAGAVVTKDVDPEVTVVGVPGRSI